VKQRWQSLLRPDDAEHVSSPSADEAFGVWMLGVLWALVCLWLGYLGSQWVLPGVLLAGLLALWGWRHREWLWWFPVVLVVATLIEPLSPLPVRGRFGPMVYIDLLAIGVVVVAVVRAVALRHPLLPRTPVDNLVVAILILFAISLAVQGAHDRIVLDFRRFVVRIVVFYATTTVASRPRGSRWVWTAFPLACAVIGLHAIWTQLRGADLAAQVLAADHTWNSRHGIFNSLLVALPVTAGLALSAGKPSARWVWMLAALIGAVGLGLHLGRTPVAREYSPWLGRWTWFEVCRTAVACGILLFMARLAWIVRRNRRHEGPRWLALTLTFLMFAVMEVIASALSGPAVPLLSTSAGLIVGTLRADRRAMRSGRAIGPVLEKAA
jgi:hypothetical protein